MDDIAKLRELLERATPGPWIVTDSIWGGGTFFFEGPGIFSIKDVATQTVICDRRVRWPEKADEMAANAALIAAAVNALPGLLDEVGRLNNKLNTNNQNFQIECLKAEAELLRAERDALKAENDALRQPATDMTHRCRACHRPYVPVGVNEDCPFCGCDGTDTWQESPK